MGTGHQDPLQLQEEQEDVAISLPPGFRFQPTEKELILHYLQRKLTSSSSSRSVPESDGLIVDFDVYSCNPWELPRHRFKYPTSQQREMYFFTPTHPATSSGRGKRCGRTAGCGVWHGAGKDVPIKNKDVATGRLVVIGHSTFFNFQINDESNSHRIKTPWLMHEYRLHNFKSLVLCKIYEKKTSNKSDACSTEPEEEQYHQQWQVQQQGIKRTRTEESLVLTEPSSIQAAATIFPLDPNAESSPAFRLLQYWEEPQATPALEQAEEPEDQRPLKRSRAQESEREQCKGGKVMAAADSSETESGAQVNTPSADMSCSSCSVEASEFTPMASEELDILLNFCDPTGDLSFTLEELFPSGSLPPLQ